MPQTAMVAWMPMTRPVTRQRHETQDEHGKSCDQRDREQCGGDLTERRNAHRRTARRSTQSKQQCDETDDAENGVQCAEYPACPHMPGPQMRRSQQAADQRGDQQQAE